MNTIVTIAAGLTALAAAAPATAQERDTGAYAALGGTYSMMPDVDSFIDNAPLPGQQVHVVNVMDDSLGFWAALGHDFGRVRAEAQVGYVANEGDLSVAVEPFPGRELDQQIEQHELRAMANAYVDLLDGSVAPYLGAGAGLVRVHNSVFGPRLPFPDEDPLQLIDDNDTRFAFQLMAGIDVAVGNRVGLVAQYRYLDAGTVDGVDSRDERFTREHRSDNIDLGLRLRF